MEHSTWVRLTWPQTKPGKSEPTFLQGNPLLMWRSSRLLSKCVSFPVKHPSPWLLVFTNPLSFIYLISLCKCLRLSCWLSGKESACQCRRSGFNPSVGKIPPGEGDGNPFQHSCLGNSMDRGAWDYSPWGHKGVRHSLVIKHHHHHRKIDSGFM